MGLYDKYLLPKITNFICGAKHYRLQRSQLIPRAFGQVLEIGSGSGTNIPFYDPEKVEKLFALEPCENSWAMAGSRLRKAAFEVEHFKTGAEEIPLPSGTIDTIMVTYTLCTIPDLDSAFKEFRRVLRPSGQLLFCEHGLAPDAPVRKWQHRITPLWKKIGGGCHLNRDIPELLKQAGFTISEMETEYLPGWKPATFNFSGSAR